MGERTWTCKLILHRLEKLNVKVQYFKTITVLLSTAIINNTMAMCSVGQVVSWNYIMHDDIEVWHARIIPLRVATPSLKPATLRGTKVREDTKQAIFCDICLHICDLIWKSDLSCKMLLWVIHSFRLVTEILSILSFIDNHEEQSLIFHLVHIWSLHEL